MHPEELTDMTICPKCGKEHRITPDICDVCGAALTNDNFSDPFAEAVKEETALREQSRLRREARLNPPKPAETESAEPQAEAADGFEDITEAAGKPRRSGMRAAAAAAALAVAAGGGWYGWKRFGEHKRPEPPGTDIRYCLGNQPYFCDGTTGRTYALGKATSLTAEEWTFFWDRTVVSDDHSRIFFPQFPALGDNDTSTFYPYYIDLASETAEPKAMMSMMYEPDFEVNCKATGYMLLDPSGESVAIRSDIMPDGANAARPLSHYTIWRDPVKYSGNSFLTELENCEAVIPFKGKPGGFFTIEESFAPENQMYLTTRINDMTNEWNLKNGRRYTLKLFEPDGQSYITVSDYLMTDWHFSVDSYNLESAADSRYLFYTQARHSDKPETVGSSFTLSRNGLAINVDNGVYSAANDLAESLPPERLQLAGHEMEQSGHFEYGTELHRVDLSTGEDTVLYFDHSEIGTCEGMRFMRNGTVLMSKQGEGPIDHTGDDQEYPVFKSDDLFPNDTVIPMVSDADSFPSRSIFIFGLLGTESSSLVLPLTMQQVRDYRIADDSGDRILFTKEDGSAFLVDCTVEGGQLYNLVFDKITPDFIKRVQTDSTGNRILLSCDNPAMYFDSTGEPDFSFHQKHYLIDLTEAGGSELSLTLTAREVCERQEPVHFCGEHIISFRTDSDSEQSPCAALLVDEQQVSQTAKAVPVFCDQDTGAFYFFEYESSDSTQSSFSILCRADGDHVTRIADRVVGTPAFDRKTGKIVFCRLEGEQYHIYAGDSASESLDDCREAASSAEYPLLFKERDASSERLYLS